MWQFHYGQMQHQAPNNPDLLMIHNMGAELKEVSQQLVIDGVSTGFY